MSIYTNKLATMAEVNYLNNKLGLGEKNEHTPSKDVVDSVNLDEARYITKRAKELGITPLEFILRPNSEKV